MASQRFRSFTIRVPDALYLEMAEAAQADDVPLNKKANDLLRLGLGKHVSLDTALRRLVMNNIVEGEATSG